MNTSTSSLNFLLRMCVNSLLGGHPPYHIGGVWLSVCVHACKKSYTWLPICMMGFFTNSVDTVHTRQLPECILSSMEVYILFSFSETVYTNVILLYRALYKNSSKFSVAVIDDIFPVLCECYVYLWYSTIIFMVFLKINSSTGIQDSILMQVFWFEEICNSISFHIIRTFIFWNPLFCFVLSSFICI